MIAQLDRAALILAARALQIDEALWRTVDQAELDARLAGLIDAARRKLEAAA